MRLDRNPLRRKLDRAEAFIYGGLLVAALAGGPVAATAGSHWALTSARQAANVQQQNSYQVRAVVLSVPQTGPDSYSVTGMIEAQAQWTSHNGTLRSGDIAAPVDSAKGDDVAIWTDAAGNVTSPPMTAAQVADQSTVGTVIAVVLTLLFVGFAAGITRFIINRRRMAAWDAAWEVTAPVWSRQG
jgi:hypothetical protein